MAYRLAKSLEKLRSQVNALAPNRSTVSDGWIGDAAHATSNSDHNPHVKDGSTGVVTAIDLTDDPMTGADMDAIAESLRRSKDPRIKYVIWSGRMFSSYPAHGHGAWAWRPYSGTNPHTKHMHLSVQPMKRLYDSIKNWMLPKPPKVWHLKATKEGRVRQVVRKAWPAARKWIRDHARNGWRVVTRKR